MTICSFLCRFSTLCTGRTWVHILIVRCRNSYLLCCRVCYKWGWELWEKQEGDFMVKAKSVFLEGWILFLCFSQTYVWCCVHTNWFLQYMRHCALLHLAWYPGAKKLISVESMKHHQELWMRRNYFMLSRVVLDFLLKTVIIVHFCRLINIGEEVRCCGVGIWEMS